MELRPAIAAVHSEAMTARLPLAFAIILIGLVPSTARPADEPDIDVLLEAALPSAPGDVPEAAPPTFVLLTNGRFFTGGSSEILEGRLTGPDQKALRELIARARKLKGLGATVEFGPGPQKFRLVLQKGREIVASGDLALATFALRPLAALIDALSHFDHPSARRYAPERYRLLVRQATLTGGCRPWTFPVPLLDALPAPRVVPASAAAGWPTGLQPASVCVGDKNYSVALRPLLPWEGLEH
jgi:hypothetical protein